jgi:hypothetical protein
MNVFRERKSELSFKMWAEWIECTRCAMEQGEKEHVAFWLQRLVKIRPKYKGLAWDEEKGEGLVCKELSILCGVQILSLVPTRSVNYMLIFPQPIL